MFAETKRFRVLVSVMLKPEVALEVTTPASVWVTLFSP